MPRPKKRDEDRRHPVPVRLSQTERETIEEAAEVAGYKNISEAIRDVLLRWAKRTIKRIAE
jgi:uncharacterized protein (DUF1778 family)